MKTKKIQPSQTQRRQSLKRRRSLVSFGVSALLAVAAYAQVATIDDSGNYRQEVQSCNSGKSQEDRATCLREARNAAADARRGRLNNQGSLQANATARCDVFKTSEDRQACEARVAGKGEESGSVAGGGMLYEYSYTVPAEPGSSAMGAGAPPSTTSPSPVTAPPATQSLPQTSSPSSSDMQPSMPESPSAPQR